MAVLTYRLVKLSNLTAAEFDDNTHNLDDRLVVLEALPSAAAGIEDVTLDEGTRQLTFIMDDATTRGPVTIPVFVPTFSGAWTPATAYSRGDIITANGSTYTVLLDHTSEAVFDPGETTTDGDYYGLLLTSPDGVLPAGGATGQSLLKASATDYHATWGDSNIPAGGSTGQFYRKTSGVDYDANWHTLILSNITNVTVGGQAHGHVLRYDATNSFWTSEPVYPIATVSTDTLSLGTSRLEKYLRFTHVDGCVITVPPAADTDFWTVLTMNTVKGQEISLRQAAGPLTIVAGVGVTINGIVGFDDGTDRVGAVVTLKYVAADTWDLFGMLAETGTA